MADYIKAVYGLYIDEKFEGQGLVEYALIIALVSIMLVAALGTLTTALDGVFAEISGSF